MFQFSGFLLGNLGVDKRDDISKDHVCGGNFLPFPFSYNFPFSYLYFLSHLALVMLLKDPSTKVRCKAAEAMSLLYDY